MTPTPVFQITLTVPEKIFIFRSQNDPSKGYEFKEVVQKPISPAYKEILEKTKNISLKHQGIVVDEGTTDDDHDCK